MEQSSIRISDYSYDLPEERIAQYPLSDRDRSRLLVLRGTEISDSSFYKLTDFLEEGMLMVWNNTRVIPSRLIFNKETGARIEIFCLEPVAPATEMNLALHSGSGCEWKCMIGNAKKWKGETLFIKVPLDGKMFVLSADKIDGGDGHWNVKFEWNHEGFSWAQVLELCGKVPLPPYIKRPPGENDHVRYQTIYAKQNGSVAAPTAGLHFTDSVLATLEPKRVQHAEVTLHVGEGTFKPVTAGSISGHQMHSEFFSVSAGALKQIAENAGNILSVGTTSLRTLESLYWLGVRTCLGQVLPPLAMISQWEPYHADMPQDIPVRTAFAALVEQVEKSRLQKLRGETQLIIVPGYQVRTARALITNFHQPHSTLLLLVAAFAGSEWRTAYQYALEHDFRFLSYGDACLFFNEKNSE